MASSSLLLMAAVAAAAAAAIEVPIAAMAPADVSFVLPKDFMSFSIEPASFPDYMGNFSKPNQFTANLLANFLPETGQEPIIRIGGATGDRVDYNPNQKEALVGLWDYSYNKDQPKNMTIGPAFWESFKVQPVGKYLMQLNAFKNTSDYIWTMQAMVNETLAAVPPERLHVFEIGNEHDAAVGNKFRPAGWNVNNYVAEWLNRSREVNSQHNNKIRFCAPDFSNVNTGFSGYDVFNETLDLNRDGWITEVSQHMYIAGAQNRISLQETLMNHTTLLKATKKVTDLCKYLTDRGFYFTMGEGNSIYGQGAASISDTFGAAIWNVDYSLYMASQNVRRILMHQGTAYRYASWLPVQVNETAPRVKPPYYGNMFVARMVGPSGKTQIAHHNLDHLHSAYGAYDDGKLARVALLNLLEFNGTSAAVPCRPATTFKVPAPPGTTEARVMRLRAREAHEEVDITLGGYKYSYENGLGKAVWVRNENITIKAVDGVFTYRVEASGAAMLTML